MLFASASLQFEAGMAMKWKSGGNKIEREKQMAILTVATQHSRVLCVIDLSILNFLHT